MSEQFAERIIDGMVDENGHCGDRAMSKKQFECLKPYLEAGETEWVNAWHGDKGGRRDFYSTDYIGNIGKYRVHLNNFSHFNERYTVVGIDLRPQAEIDLENHLRELGKFEGSEWVAEPKERIDMELELVRVHEYERMAYGRYNATETVHIYTMADADGNCIVWKTANWLEVETVDEDGYCHFTEAEPGDKVRIRATVKEHSEWRGTRQTVVTRAKVEEVVKRAA